MFVEGRKFSRQNSVWRGPMVPKFGGLSSCVCGCCRGICTVSLGSSATKES